VFFLCVRPDRFPSLETPSIIRITTAEAQEDISSSHVLRIPNCMRLSTSILGNGVPLPFATPLTIRAAEILAAAHARDS